MTDLRLPHAAVSSYAPDAPREEAAALLRLIFTSATRRFRSVERRVGASAAALRVLSEVVARPGSRVGDVASRLRLNPSTVSNLVRELERRAWLVKARSLDDQRSVALRATAEGAAALARVGQDVRYFMELTGKLSDGELRRALEGLRVLAQYL